MKEATLCFLVEKDSNDKIKSICLAMKKRGFGEGKWNGVGGKVEPEKDKSVKDALIRETQEEISVTPLNIEKVGYLRFDWPNKPEFNMDVHVYFSYSWEGKPTESEEMLPKWHNIDEIPYDDMWVTDQYWFKEILSGKKIKANFEFKDDSELKGYQIEEVDTLK